MYRLQRENRLRGSDTKRANTGDLINQRRRCCARRQDRIHGQFQCRSTLCRKLRHMADHPCVEGWNLLRLKAQATRHRMAAP